MSVCVCCDSLAKQEREGVYTIYPCSRALPYFLNDLLLGDGTGSYGIYANYDDHRLYFLFFFSISLKKNHIQSIFYFFNKKKVGRNDFVVFESETRFI